MDSLQKLCSSLEPMLRRIVSAFMLLASNLASLSTCLNLVLKVSEEVEKAMSRMAPQIGALSLVQRSAFRQIIHGLGPYS